MNLLLGRWSILIVTRLNIKLTLNYSKFSQFTRFDLTHTKFELSQKVTRFRYHMVLASEANSGP